MLGPKASNATYQAIRSMALWFWRRRFLKGFYHIWAWRPSWSCDPDPANKLLFPHPIEAPCEIWLWLAQRFWRRSCLKSVDGRMTDGRTDDGPWLYYKLTNEPKGSGELKSPNFQKLQKKCMFTEKNESQFNKYRLMATGITESLIFSRAEFWSASPDPFSYIFFRSIAAWTLHLFPAKLT